MRGIRSFIRTSKKKRDAKEGIVKKRERKKSMRRLGARLYHHAMDSKVASNRGSIVITHAMLASSNSYRDVICGHNVHRIQFLVKFPSTFVWALKQIRTQHDGKCLTKLSDVPIAQGAQKRTESLITSLRFLDNNR